MTSENPFTENIPGLQKHGSQTAIELLLTQPDLLTSLRKAHMGNYGIILSLLGCIDQGLKSKKLVDRVIDSCMCIILSWENIGLTDAACR